MPKDVFERNKKIIDEAWDNFTKQLKADANYIKIIDKYNKAYQERSKASGK